MIFELIPNLGLLPVALNAPREEVVSILGSGWFVDQHSRSGEDAIRSADASVHVVFRCDRVIEVSVSPPSIVTFGSLSLFEHREVWKELVALEPRPLEAMGAVILKNLGVSFTGLHDGDLSQLSVTSFESGRFDELDKVANPLAS